jgi:PTS system mannose-specific IID component
MTATQIQPDSTAAPSIPRRVWAATYLRLFAVQGAWNYETLLGNGVAFCMIPLLKLLPVDRHKDALVREAQYFNSHPYMAAVAVGALARAELDGEDAIRIERFRTALCGPLGSMGDQLVWAAWLPICSIIALGAFGVGASPLVTLCIFLGLYNAGHLALRAWGLHVGLARGVRVAPALATPILRRGPQIIGKVAALLAGIALPLAVHRALGPGRELAGAVVVAAVLGASLLARVQGRTQGWSVALVVLAAFVLYSVVL